MVLLRQEAERASTTDASLSNAERLHANLSYAGGLDKRAYVQTREPAKRQKRAVDPDNQDNNDDGDVKKIVDDRDSYGDNGDDEQ